MKRKTAFIIMICLYLVTGAAACAILFSSGLRSSTPAVSADPSAQTESSEATDPSAQTESSEATDSSAQTESSETANSAVQTESPDSADSSAGPEQVAEPSESPETPSAQKEEVKYRGIADQDKGKRLFIRKSPSTEGEVLGVLWTGQSGEIIDIGDEWVLLKYGDIEGYVFKEFLIIEELPQSADPQGL